MIKILEKLNLWDKKSSNLMNLSYLLLVLGVSFALLVFVIVVIRFSIFGVETIDRFKPILLIDLIIMTLGLVGMLLDVFVFKK